MSEQIRAERWQILFNVRRSICYHDRRHAFFAGVNRLVVIIGLLGYALESLGASAWLGAPLLPGLVALVFAISIGFDTINKAYLYQELKRRTAEIEVALVDAEPTSEMIRKARRDLLRIEQDEPPVKHALNTMCHNEVAYVSQVHNKYLQEVRWYKRLTAQFFSWPNDKKLSDLAAPSVE